MTAKFSSALPDGEANGLGPILRVLADEPQRLHLLLVAVDVKSVTRNSDTGEQSPTLRVRRVEVVHRDDLSEAERLVRRALERRTGDTVLPLETENELDELGDLFDRIAAGEDDQ